MTAGSDAFAPTDPGHRELPPQGAREVRRGESIGRYAVLDRLGAGGMGVVYAAYDPDLDRKVAIKLLHRHERGWAGATDAPSPAAQRLLREAQAMARLDHPNVVAVHDVGTFDGTVFVAMEFIRGVTLREWMTEARDASDTLAMFVQAGRGLAVAHGQGLVHRDFKPDNVMVGHDGRARVMDFGLVRAVEGGHAESEPEPSGPTGASLESADPLDPEHGAADAMARVRARLAGAGKIAASAEQQTLPPDATQKPDALRHAEGPSRTERASVAPMAATLTRTGAMMGTPAYMSPEQVQCTDVDARSDQFSFAVALWEALQGERPFAGETLAMLSDAIANGPRPAPPTLPGLPRTVPPALLRALAIDRDERFETMDALLVDLAPASSGGRWMGLTTAAIVSAGAIAASATWAGRSDTPCQGAQAAIDAVYNDAVRSDVVTALQAISAAHAPVTADKVAAALDTYAQAWSVGHTDACEATRVRGEQSETVLDLRMACLDTRLAELDALGTILRTADRTVASKAIEAVAHLPAVDACADRAALSTTTEPPRNEGERRRVAQIRRQLALAAAQDKTGQYAQAEETARQALLAAQALQYGPVVAEAAVRLGLVQATRGKTSEAVQHLEDAALRGRASGALATAAVAEAWLTYVVGRSAGQRDLGLWWSRHAEAEIERLGGDPPVRADLLNHKGVLLQLGGDTQAATEALSQALQIRQRLLGEDHPDTAEAHYNLGVLYRRAGDYDQAQTEHERARTTRQAVFGPEHPKVAESLAGLGAVAGAMGQADTAATHYAQALAIQRAAFGDDHIATAQTREALAILAAKSGDFAAARDHLDAALGVYQARLAADDPRLARAWLNLGNLAIEHDDPAAARLALSRAVDAFERSAGPNHPKLGRALAALGQACLDDGDRSAAITALTRAADIVEASTSEAVVRGHVYKSLARAHWPDHPAQARESADRAARLLTEAGPAGASQLAELRAWSAATLDADPVASPP